MQIGEYILESSMEFPENIKNEIALWPSNSLLGIYLKKPKNVHSKGYMHPHVYWCIIYNNQYMEAIQVPISRWVNNIYNGMLLSHKKEWNHIVCDSMDGPIRYYTKWK